MVHAPERRAAPRVVLDKRVSVYHPQLGRSFSGRTVNVSTSGVLVRVPLSMPAVVGQPLELRYAVEEDDPPADADAGALHQRSGAVVRLDRGGLLAGELMVAMQF